MTTAYVGIGSNLHDPRRQVRQALDELARIRETKLTGQSSFYRTAPLGYAAQADFVNAVARLDTALGAEALLGELQAIEARHQRVRSFADAPRTLDLDLLLYGEATLSTGQLTVPHPRMHERAFVLAPLVEIAPDAVIPGVGAAADCLARCSGQGIEKIDG
ncbi:MAG: 2-amino-4-hydroxy-6-hydroxymethyldihydropteridine diphosphokinase [Betaproteobacteria bacterium]